MAIAQSKTPDEHAPSILAALSELAVKVQRQRTVDSVLETAGRGIRDLGMRLVAFELRGEEIVLRHLATSPGRQSALELRLGRPLPGLTARADEVNLVLDAMLGRRILFRHDLDVFASFLRRAAGYDPSPLELVPETASVTNGVLAPIFVRDEPWGLLAVYSRALTRADSDAVALFATYVGSAIEVAGSLEALEAAQRELVERERLAALGELAAVVAHEVRNPLGVLFNSIGGLRTITERDLPAESREGARTLLGIAEEEANRLNRIVSDLLDLARPYEVELVPSSVERLISEVAAEASDDPRLSLDVAPDLPPIDLDAGYMRQALLNLLLNALQAVPCPSGSVTIRACVVEEGGRSLARIDVIDTGPGIPDHARASIFEPFFTTKAKGTGLGLAIAKRIVDAHGGELGFVTAADGTTFSITLPISRHDAWPPATTGVLAKTLSERP